MIKLKAKVTNTASSALDGLLRRFEDQQQLNRDAMEAAGPVADAARGTIARKTGRTGDQITVWANPEAAQGEFGVFVGIPGPEVTGSRSRAYIGHFLEFGTSKTKAQPWLRPADDAHGGPRLMQRFAAILQRRIGR